MAYRDPPGSVKKDEVFTASMISHKQHFLAWSLSSLARLTTLRSTSNVSFDASLFSDERKQACMKTLARTSEDYSRVFRNVKTDVVAAVLVPFCLNPRGEPSVLLTLRSRKLSRHGGIISFPGGIADTTDASDVSTALRETQEELGLPPTDVDVWGSMNALPSLGSKILVTPVVGYVRSSSSPAFIDELVVNTDEVECVLVPTLKSLCDPEGWEYTQWTHPGVPGHVSPVFKLDGRDDRVWGLTARILHLALGALVPESYSREYPPKLLNLKGSNSPL
ncbi:nucleoside diphosphate-linked moiety X motif 8-like [Ixodes scapularis]